MHHQTAHKRHWRDFFSAVPTSPPKKPNAACASLVSRRPLPDMDPKHKGAHGEVAAILWLLEQGYEVFRNISQHGPADLMAWRPGEVPVPIDVKTAATYTKGDGEMVHKYDRANTSEAVRVLLVTPEGFIWAEQ